jgi:hypothetical protein
MMLEQVPFVPAEGLPVAAAGAFVVAVLLALVVERLQLLPVDSATPPWDDS